MKRNLIFAIGCLLSAHPAYGQGQGAVIFENYGGVYNAPVRYGSNGVPPGKAGLYVGNSWRAELAYYVGTTTNPGLLTLLPSSITSFYGNFDGDVANGAGYFQGPTVNISGVTSPALASAVTFEVFVWDATGGATYYTAPYAAHSNIFTIGIGGTGTPPNIPLPSDFGASLQPITLGIPEPSTLALAGLGAAGLLLFRRRN